MEKWTADVVPRLFGNRVSDLSREMDHSHSPLFAMDSDSPQSHCSSLPRSPRHSQELASATICSEEISVSYLSWEDQASDLGATSATAPFAVAAAEPTKMTESPLNEQVVTASNQERTTNQQRRRHAAVDLKAALDSEEEKCSAACSGCNGTPNQEASVIGEADETSPAFEHSPIACSIDEALAHWGSGLEKVMLESKAAREDQLLASDIAHIQTNHGGIDGWNYLVSQLQRQQGVKERIKLVHEASEEIRCLGRECIAKMDADDDGQVCQIESVTREDKDVTTSLSEEQSSQAEPLVECEEEVESPKVPSEDRSEPIEEGADSLDEAVATEAIVVSASKQRVSTNNELEPAEKVVQQSTGSSGMEEYRRWHSVRHDTAAQEVVATRLDRTNFRQLGLTNLDRLDREEVERAESDIDSTQSSPLQQCSLKWNNAVCADF